MATERNEQPNMSSVPIDVLELRALEQRSDLHNTAAALRARISQIRDQLNVPQQARNHRVAGSLIAAVLGVASGYGFAGLFTRY